MHERMMADGVTLIIRGQKNTDTLKGRFQSGDVVNGIEFLYPSEDMTDEDCFQVMRDHGVEIPRYYTEGLAHSGDCSTCTAWVHEETRAEYLKKYHPIRFEKYKKDIVSIAAAAESSIAGLARAVAAVNKE
jgi:phosphoadenosine phosphosulfate reductase